MKRHSIVLPFIVAMLWLGTACGGQAEPAPVPTEPPPAQVVTAESPATAVPASSPTPQSDDAEITASIGLSPRQISLDTQGLPYPWQANTVLGTPYDASQPPGPTGLPDHIEINFGTMDPANRQPTDPIMYIIPVNAYRQLWDDAGNEAVSKMVEAIYQKTVALPYPPQTSGLPALPFEMVVGTNDIAAQVGRTTPTDISASQSGFRFYGRFAQSPNPVTNQDMQYVYQGFTNDGKYLVLFFYPPVTTSYLPATAADVPQSETDAMMADMTGYLNAKAEELNALPTSDWDPDLSTLDALVASLSIVNMPPTGLQGQVWRWVAESDGYEETPVTFESDYTVTFLPDGRLAFQADCNSGTGVYDASGGMVGSLATELGAMTMAACSPDSRSDDLIGTLQSAQNYKVRPGGALMELVRPAGGGSLIFTAVGAAETAPPDNEQPEVELPTPEPSGPYGRVTAQDGLNLRSGPGTAYPVVGMAPFGTEGAIVGRSADGQWWVAAAPSINGGVVWASASFVEAFNAANVPVIPAPPLPIPPTATPTATPPPQAEISFWADSTSITQGQCTTLRWQVENIQAVWVYPLGQPYNQFPVTGQGSREVCPSFTTTYEMRVLKQDGSIELRQVTVAVSAPANPLLNTNWSVATINLQAVLPANQPLTLNFADTTVNGSGGCNTYNGPYRLSGSNLTIGPLAGTQALCGNESLDQQEAAYVNALQSTASYVLSGDMLILRNAANAEVMRLFLNATQ
ncbi:MAG: META domain-containing protein [Anaerolineales bacterium]|nr:META domain-containing protein [Anaerolineales bacterium]